MTVALPLLGCSASLQYKRDPYCYVCLPSFLAVFQHIKRTGHKAFKDDVMQVQAAVAAEAAGSGEAADAATPGTASAPDETAAGTSGSAAQPTTAGKTVGEVVAPTHREAEREYEAHVAVRARGLLSQAIRRPPEPTRSRKNMKKKAKGKQRAKGKGRRAGDDDDSDF